MIRVSANPIGPWPLVAIAAAAVVALTVWAYRQRLQGTAGRWRWVALGLRLAAVLLCLLAALRPSVVIPQKTRQDAAVALLLDDSASMQLTDEANDRSRWDAARAALKQARAEIARAAPDLKQATYRFSSTLHEADPAGAEAEEGAGDTAEAAPDAKEPGEKARPAPKQEEAKAAAADPAEDLPAGSATALGSALMEALKRQAGTRLAAVVVLSDGANNDGTPPLTAAQRLKGQQVPIVSVGFGSETAGANSRDVSAREVIAGPTVFVKNILQVRATLGVRGYPGKPLDVELLVDDRPVPVDRATVKAAEGAQAVPLTLKYTPEKAGETKLTVRVRPQEGELIKTNNEISTFVSVLGGGLNVLYLQGPGFSWEFKYLNRAIQASPDIRADLVVAREPAGASGGVLKDEDFAPGRYDVYILCDLPADYMTRAQRRLLTQAVERGAGLMMLGGGGRGSFGPGGWAGTEVAEILPVRLHPGDGQLEPPGGLKVVPNPTALGSYVLQIGPDRARSAQLWDALPPLTGANRFRAKEAAVVLALTPDGEPLLVSLDLGRGRTMAFGGETWVWARASEATRAAHRKFWRQLIFWLAHREDQGENQVRLTLDRRRVGVGGRLDLSAVASDKNGPIPDARFETTVVRLDPDARPEPVELYNQGDAARGTYYATGAPGEYRVSVKATRDGEEIGSDSARFLVYQDDRELDNPAADHDLLRQLAEVTGGQFLAPEDLAKFARSLEGAVETDATSQVEHRIWDNWPFFLTFVALLTAEWWLRKRHGWV